MLVTDNERKEFSYIGGRVATWSGEPGFQPAIVQAGGFDCRRRSAMRPSLPPVPRWLEVRILLCRWMCCDDFIERAHGWEWTSFTLSNLTLSVHARFHNADVQGGGDTTPSPRILKLRVVELSEKKQRIALHEYSQLVVWFFILGQNLTHFGGGDQWSNFCKIPNFSTLH